ncbi:CBS domain-containing protein [Aestuariirhabdus sp. LZHN29]|uniref:CBS domain-containing protein n=1 Tax=Aestuariirhabdus sp. LZHN29 TaxID=3417462 RepID=UPI003CEE0C9D
MPTKVSEYMTAKVITVKTDLGVREAFFTMRDEGVRHLPVVDESNKLVGIVSDRELRRPNWVDEDRDITHIYDLNNDLDVSDIMVRNVFCLHTYDSLSKAVKLLLEQRVGAVPVLDKTEALVGMLSAIDLLKALDDKLDAERKR